MREISILQEGPNPMIQSNSDTVIPNNSLMPASDRSVCIIGAGASGLAAALALNEVGYTVSVIEKNVAAGSAGHSSSTEFLLPNGERHSANPAFGMFFLSRYPNFHAILKRLNIEIESIGCLKSSYTTFSLDGKFQSTDAEEIFHTKGIIDEIKRFLQATREIIQNTEYDYVTAEQYFADQSYSRAFVHYYFLGYVVVFFGGHPLSYYLKYPIRLLIAGKYSAYLDPSLREETMYRIKKGTGHYIQVWHAYLAERGVRFYFSTTPRVMARDNHDIHITLEKDGQPPESLVCNYLIVSTLPDDALAILGQTITSEEQAVLGAFPITHDTAVLHVDTHFMPQDKAVWRYGNHIVPNRDEMLTLDRPFMFTAHTLCNYDRVTDIFCTYAYRQNLDIEAGYKITNRHIQVTPHTVRLREQLVTLQGRKNTWFVGSWTKNLTLHEDAIVSGLEVANKVAGKNIYTLAEEPHLTLLTAMATDWGQDATFIDVFKKQVSRHGDKKAFISIDDSGKEEADTITYQELEVYAKKIATQLTTKWHAQPGDRILLCYKQGIDFIAAFLGCLFAGMIPAPFSPMDLSRIKTELDKFSALMADCGAKIILTDKYYHRYYRWSRLLSVSSYFKFILARWRATDTLRYEAGKEFLCLKRQATELAYLQYTSGSTGMPKGVMVSHKNLLAQLKMLKTTLEFTDEVVGCYWIPQFHSFSLVSCILLPICIGATTVILSPQTFLRNPEIFAECLSRYRVTLTACPSFGLRYLLEKTTYKQREQWDWSQLNKIMVGAEPIDAQLLNQFIQAFAVTGLKENVMQPAYGMTEHVLGITLGGSRYYHMDKQALQEDRLIRPGDYPIVGCGQPPTNVTIKIVATDTHQVLGEDEVGEIWIDSPSKALGYWNNPKATQETFYAALPNDLSGRTYLRSGDLGFFHQGELYICGRAKDVLIVRGHNVFPTDIERAVEKELSGGNLNGCAVIGVTKNTQLGEEVVVILELDSNVTDVVIFENMAKRARSAMVNTVGITPYSILFIQPNSMPRTRTHKLRRAPCKTAYLEGKLPVVYEDVVGTKVLAFPAKSTQSVMEIIGIALKNLTRQTIDFDKPISQQISLDSLQAAELVSALSLQLSVEIPMSALINHQTVRSLASYIETLPKSDVLHPAVVLLNATTSAKQAPLFLIHPVRGRIEGFLELSKVWDYPIYAIQQLRQYTSLEEMAMDYMAIIKTIQPSGPYFIGGYSFGGTLGLEVANQLLGNADVVSGILLIDELHAATDQSGASDFSATGLFLQVAKDYVSEEKYLQLMQIATPLPDEPATLPLLAQHLQNNRLAQQILQETETYQANIQLLARYNEKPRKLPAVLIGLFKTAESFNKNVKAYSKVVEISGTHATLLMPPHVKQLATEIKAWVDEVILKV